MMILFHGPKPILLSPNLHIVTKGEIVQVVVFIVSSTYPNSFLVTCKPQSSVVRPIVMSRSKAFHFDAFQGWRMRVFIDTEVV